MTTRTQYSPARAGSSGQTYGNGNGNGRASGTGTPPAIAPVRCAIYTRKSTEEGLDQEFNSLDAQREAAEAYIASQRQEGWLALPDRYDDGGYSGGTLERPALKRLMRDIEAGRVDIILCYKVDRLSRSLLDFTRIVEVFDRCGVSFAAITQSFNTTTSMGRLTLNILLSFAQFEREIIAERIRDKVAAAKKKGKYCGGPPNLGYDVDREKRRLLVNPEEARLVRHIFKRFVQLRSTTDLVRELNTKGTLTKAWVTAKGQVREGGRWDKSHVYRLLNNQIYLGEVTHKGITYPGEHEAIVTREAWDEVQAILNENTRARGNATRTQTVALLRGVIRCGHCGCAMGPTYTRKNGRQYRYYLCVHASKKVEHDCPVRTVPAGDVEQVVMEQLRSLFRSPELVARTYAAAKQQETDEVGRLTARKTEIEGKIKEARERALQIIAEAGQGRRTAGSRGGFLSDALDEVNAQAQTLADELQQSKAKLEALTRQSVTEDEVRRALAAIEPLWDQLFPAEQNRIVRLLVDKVEIREDGMEVALRGEGLGSVVGEIKAIFEQANGRNGQ